MYLGQGLQGLSQLVWMRCCQLGNRSRSHGRYLRSALPFHLSWYSYFYYTYGCCKWCLEKKLTIVWVCVKQCCTYMQALYCFVIPYWKQRENISTSSRLSNSGAIQKHVKVRQTSALLAAFLMHVIALAIHPPCITSWLNDRLIHLWVWVVNLTKGLSCLGCQC